MGRIFIIDAAIERQEQVPLAILRADVNAAAQQISALVAGGMGAVDAALWIVASSCLSKLTSFITRIKHEVIWHTPGALSQHLTWQIHVIIHWAVKGSLLEVKLQSIEGMPPEHH